MSYLRHFNKTYNSLFYKQFAPPVLNIQPRRGDMFIEIGESQNRSPIGANYVLIVLKSIICVQIEHFYRAAMSWSMEF